MKDIKLSIRYGIDIRHEIGKVVLWQQAMGDIQMGNFDIAAMQKIQKELQEKYKDKWGGLSPDKARNQLLWLYSELGEVGDVIKKSGDDKIMNDSDTRRHFIEEMCDVMMYFNDVLLCYDISPEEFEKIYLEKHQTNLNRW